MLEAINTGGFTRNLAGLIQPVCQDFRQNLVNQRRFPGPRNPGNAGEHTQWNADINVLEIVFLCANHSELTIGVNGAPRIGHAQRLAAGQIRTGDGFFTVYNPCGWALVNHFPTVFARAGADVHKPVGGFDGVLIVLDHNEGVADVTQMLQGGNQSLVVPLM